MSADQYFLKGKYKLSTIPHEMRMSHWVYAPILVSTETNEIILSLEGNVWDLRSAREVRDSIILKLARYPDGKKEYELELAPLAETAKISGVAHPLAKVVEVLDAIV